MNKLMAVLVVFTLAQCSGKKTSDDQGSGMKEFHQVMAAVYHPYMDSGNLKPLREHIGELVVAADAWSTMSNEPTLKSLLDQLSADSRKLEGEVRNGATDGVIGQSLTALHEEFHKAMEMNGGHEREGEKD
jgi:hypothetical protein